MSATETRDFTSPLLWQLPPSRLNRGKKGEKAEDRGKGGKGGEREERGADAHRPAYRDLLRIGATPFRCVYEQGWTQKV